MFFFTKSGTHKGDPESQEKVFATQFIQKILQVLLHAKMYIHQQVNILIKLLKKIV